MSYWLYVTNLDNWGVTKETKILGVSKRHRNALSRTKIGDKCVVYTIADHKGGKRTDPQIVGAYSVASSIFEDDTEIFSSVAYGRPEVFNYRIKLKPLKTFKHPVDFRALVPQLAFIKSKKNYSWHIRGRAVIEIPESDYNLIMSKASG